MIGRLWTQQGVETRIFLFLDLAKQNPWTETFWLQNLAVSQKISYNSIVLNYIIYRNLASHEVHTGTLPQGTSGGVLLNVTFL